MKQLFGTILLFSLTQNLAAQDTTHFAKPYFTSTAINSVQLNSAYTYQVGAADSAALSLSFSIIKMPTWLKYDSIENKFSGKAIKTGQYPIQVKVSNKHSSATQSFMVTVYDKKTVNILCLGNSITNGTSKYNSYRRSLWQLLHAKKYNVDFIGSWDKHHMGGDVPDPDFDMDHEGHSGWRFDDIFHAPSWDSARGNINSWLQAYTPDIVLLELGTNDVFQCRTIPDMLNDLQQLIELLRKKKGTIKVFLAQIPPLGKQWAGKKLCDDSTSYDQAIRNLNKAFVGFVKIHSKPQSPVILVDQYNGINTDTEMYDDIHPNEAGEKKMAAKWFIAIRKYLKKLD